MFSNFLELAESRYSVRKYDARPIEQEKLDRILRAGQVAPTAANAQPQRILVLKSEEALSRVRAVTHFHFGAPMVLLICYDRRASWKARDGHDSGPVDTAIVVTQMMLEAFDEGIGSCWVGYFNAQQVSQVLELPENVTVSALLPIGYPAENAQPAPLHSQYRDYADTIAEI